MSNLTPSQQEQLLHSLRVNHLLVPLNLPMSVISPVNFEFGHVQLPIYRAEGFADQARSRSISAVITDGSKYQVTLDLHHYELHEITVKIVSNSYIMVEAQHNEKRDQQGYVSRHFVRKFMLSNGYDFGKITSTLSSDGRLTITVPKSVNVEEPLSIPIVQTELPGLGSVTGVLDLGGTWASASDGIKSAAGESVVVPVKKGIVTADSSEEAKQAEEKQNDEKPE